MTSTSSQQWIVYDHDELEGLQLQEVSIPKPGDYEVLVKIHAVSLNYRDFMIVTGTYMWPTNDQVVPWCVIHPTDCRNQLIETSSDAAGELISVGPKTTRFKPGSRVTTVFFQNFIAGKLALDGTTTDLGGRSDGVLRRYAIFNEQNLVEMPAHLSYAEGSTLPCAALTAWNSLFGTERVMPGDTVLTQGSGGVSLFAIQFAVLAGAQVIATTSSEKKAVLLKQLGAHQVVKYSEDANWGDTARRLSFDQRGADFVIEIGGSNTMTQSLKAVAMGGQIAVVGTRAGQHAASNPSFHSATCTVRRIFCGSRLQFEQMCRAISLSGLKPVVDSAVLSFEQAKDAFRYLADQKHVGKVVIEVISDSGQEHL